MKAVIQAPCPTICCYHSIDNNNLYYKFSKDSLDYSGRNLQSYSFMRNANDLQGSFNFTVKEQSNNDSLTSTNLFLDKVKPLDVITIIEKENGKPDFIGVVTNITFSASSSGLQKMINISGKSIEYLFEFLNLSNDKTCMTWAKQYWNEGVANTVAKLFTTKKGDDVEVKFGTKVKDVIQNIYSDFISKVKEYKSLSNYKIAEIIDNWYGGEIFEIEDDLEMLPVTANLYSNNVITFANFLRQLLPANVYEIYGIIKDGSPKIRIRKVPFLPRKWKDLPYHTIKGEHLTDYTFTRSIDEVYTAFCAYIENGPFDPSYHMNVQATINGNKACVFDTNKFGIYGYKLLQTNFVGFSTEMSENAKKDTFSEKVGDITEELLTYYKDLDEMWDASIGIVNVLSEEHSTVGEKIKILDGEFYVMAVNHSWNYGGTIKINYNCERGGMYTADGSFSPLKNISKPLAELT